MCIHFRWLQNRDNSYTDVDRYRERERGREIQTEQINGENTAETCVYVGVLCVCVCARRVVASSNRSECLYRTEVAALRAKRCRPTARPNACTVLCGGSSSDASRLRGMRACVFVYVYATACLPLPACTQTTYACVLWFLCACVSLPVIQHKHAVLRDCFIVRDCTQLPQVWHWWTAGSRFGDVDIWRFHKKINNHCDGYICCDVHLV